MRMFDRAGIEIGLSFLHCPDFLHDLGFLGKLHVHVGLGGGEDDSSVKLLVVGCKGVSDDELLVGGEGGYSISLLVGVGEGVSGQGDELLLVVSEGGGGDVLLVVRFEGVDDDELPVVSIELGGGVLLVVGDEDVVGTKLLAVGVEGCDGGFLSNFVLDPSFTCSLLRVHS